MSVGAAHGLHDRLGLWIQHGRGDWFWALVDVAQYCCADFPEHKTDTPTFAPFTARLARRLLDTPTTACLVAV